MNYRRRKRAMHHAEAHAEGASASHSKILDHALVTKADPELINTTKGLGEFLDHIREERVFAFDTEFIGEETFYPKICLIQLATSRRVALVDPVEFSVANLAPLWEAVCGKALTTIVHAGGQDIDAAQRAAGKQADNVVDTQVAAAFLGMPWPVSLGNVVHGLCDHRLHKAHTLTDWDQRPLTKSQLAYAADDVRYLPLVWNLQEGQLTKNGRIQWAAEESRESLRTSEEFNPESQVRRAARGLGFRPRVMTILRELVVFRYQNAKSLNVPPRTLLPDGPLLELARGRYSQPSELGEIRGLSRTFVQDHGHALLKAIEEARGLPLDRDRIWTAPEESAEDRTKVDALWSILTMRCISMGLSTGMVLTRAELSRWYLARASSEATLFSAGSWRDEAIGLWLREFLAGKETLRLGWRDGGPVVP